MTLIYKILPSVEWEAARIAGRFDDSAIDLADGYIHLSAGPQAQETARKYFSGRGDLVLLTVEADALGEALKWEPSRGGDLFPHLYAALDVGQVLAARPLELDAEGVPVLGALA